MRRGPLARQLPPPGRGESDEVRRLVARQLVTEEILALEAETAGLVGFVPGQGSTRRQEVSLRRLVPLLFDRVTSGITVAEEDVRDYYERNLDRYWTPELRHVRHILLGDRAAARWVMSRLRRGVRFGALARRYSLDAGSRSAGGDIGEIRRGQLAGALEDPLFHAAVGAVVGPIRSEQGWHLARVERVIPEGCAAFDDVSPSIAGELLGAARQRAFEDWLEARRDELVILDPQFAHPADPAHGTPTHRH